MTDLKWDERLRVLDDLAMSFGTSVTALYSEDYLDEFNDFYRVENRDPKLVSSDDSFYGTIKRVSGFHAGALIADETERLFGLPDRVTVFEDDADLKEELGGSEGYGPFFFVNAIMFCEYENFTLCFISGSND